jgi:hypothetical protein
MVLPVIKYLKKKKLVDEVILATPESRLEGLKSNQRYFKPRLYIGY